MNIAMCLDPCHMIKLVRNTSENIYDSHGKEIKWQFKLNLLNLQSTFSFANKLTPRYEDF